MVFDYQYSHQHFQIDCIWINNSFFFEIYVFSDFSRKKNFRSNQFDNWLTVAKYQLKDLDVLLIFQQLVLMGINENSLWRHHLLRHRLWHHKFLQSRSRGEFRWVKLTHDKKRSKSTNDSADKKIANERSAIFCLHFPLGKIKKF